MKNNALFHNKKLFLLYIYIYIYYSKSNIFINKKKYNNNLNIYLNYYYIFFYLLYKILNDNFYELNKKNKYFKNYNFLNLNNFFIKYKDNNLFIFLESYKKCHAIHKYKYDYLYKRKKIKIYLYKNFKFKTEIYIYLIYRDYIEFIKRYKYNEYLDENPIIFQYPILKLLLRNIDQSFLKMIRKKESEFIRKEDIIINYDMYNININKIKKKYLYISNLKYINIFLYNLNILKLILLFFKMRKIKKNIKFKIFSGNMFLYFFWLRKIVHYEITKVYNYYLEGYDWTKSEKLKADNIYDFFWQMNRYGFMLYYYMPLNSNIYFYDSIKHKIIKINNLINLHKFSNKKKIYIKIINLFWYEIIKIISRDYVKRYLFIFFYFHKFENLYMLYRHNTKKIREKFDLGLLYKRKSLNLKYIYLRFKDLMNIINFRIYPINSKIYYNKKNLLFFMKNNKKNFDNIYWQIFFFKDYYYYYYFDTNLIFKKIFLDIEININYNIIINLLYNYILKYNIENLIFNNYYYLLNINNIILKIIKKMKIINNNKLLFIQRNKFISFFKTYYGIDWWYKFYKLHKIDWKWMYEFLLLFYMYRIYIVDLYWCLFIFII